MIRYEHIFDIEDIVQTNYVYLWTGNSALWARSRWYQPSGLLAGADVSELAGLGDTESRMTLRLHVPTSALRTKLLTDPGAASVRVGGVYSVDDGVTWTAVQRGFRGRVSGATLSEGLYEVDLVSRDGDPFRRYVRSWSREQQRALYPRDSGLDGVAQLESGKEIGWPFSLAPERPSEQLLYPAVSAVDVTTATIQAVGSGSGARIDWEVSQGTTVVHSSFGSAGVRNLNLTGLTADTDYRVRIRSCQTWVDAPSAAYCGAWTDVYAFRTRPAPVEPGDP